MNILKKMNPSKFKSAASALLQFNNVWKNSRREDAVLSKRLVENTFLFSKSFNNNITCNIIKDDCINNKSPSNRHQGIEQCQLLETKQRSNSDLQTPRHRQRCSNDDALNDENKLPPISNTNSILRAASDEKIREGRSARKKR